MKKITSYKTILLLLGLVTLVLFTCIYILFNDIKNRNEHVSVLENDLFQQASKQEYLISTERIIQNSNSDINRINNSIVASDEDVSFVEGIESIAKGDGLSISIDSLSFADDSVSNKKVTLFKIRTRIVGSWSATHRFISQLESLPVKTKINRLSLSAGSDLVLFGEKKPTNGVAWESTVEMSVLKYK